MAEPLRNMYDDVFVSKLISAVAKHYPKLDKARLKKHFSTKDWKDAPLKTRVRLIAYALHDVLPKNYKEALSILIPTSAEFEPGYLPIFFPDYVEVFGKDHWEESMRAFEVFTQSSSAEFAIRSFILTDQKRTLDRMEKWSRHKNVHVRRLASEGCRPRLPWGQAIAALKKNPHPVLVILENLKDDPELYVRKSVANHLNDISKDHPDIALKIATSWYGKSERTDWVVKHALRGLLKKGNTDALKLIGLNHKAKIDVPKLLLTNSKLKIGDSVQFSFDLDVKEKKPQNTRIEYAIDYVKSNGSHSRKVFQLAQRTLDPGIQSFRRVQRLTDFTTRKHYPGVHHLHILVNGVVAASESFILKA